MVFKLQIKFKFTIMKQTGYNQSEKAINHKITTQLQLFAMTKEALVKRVQLLTHQLAIYYRASKLQTQNNNNQSTEQINKQIIEKDIIIETMTRNHKMLQSQYNKIQIQRQEQKSLIAQKDCQINKLRREMEIYKKKNEQYEKCGGRPKIDRLQSQIKKQKLQIQSQISDNKKTTKMWQELINKVAILQKLNLETEQKLADALTTKISISKTTLQLNQQVNKENIGQGLSQNKFKLQIYSLKQKIRCLRQDLRLSQESKEQLRNKMQQRECFYSKMIASKK